MMAGGSSLMIQDAEKRFAVRIKVAVPPGGFGQRLSQIDGWLDENAGVDGWVRTPAGLRGVVNDAVAIYFRDAQHAAAFVSRWCRHAVPEVEHGAFQMRDDDPQPRGRLADH